MRLTGSFLGKEFHENLSSQQIKTYREYFALGVLKVAFPTEFSKLSKRERPDLQDVESNLGVEVVWGGSPRDEQIMGESIKYKNAKSVADREKSLRIIRKNGGNRNEYSISFPLATSASDKYHLLNAFKKKCKKAIAYRGLFQELGLAILIEIPFSLFNHRNWGEWFVEENDGAYNFVAIIHMNGVELYYFNSQKYERRKMSRDNMRELRTIARLTVEGEIRENDSVWN